MARNLTRKLIDGNGHQWAVEFPPDVNADSVEDILIAAGEGLVKLQGYLLDGEPMYRLPADNTEIPNGKKMFSFFKKLPVVDVAQKDFATAMQNLIDEARKSRINKIRLTEFEGRKVEQDSRGYFINWEIPCHICSVKIAGVRRLSMSEGEFTRAQAFLPFDDRVVQYRPGSRLRVCGSCAPKQLTAEEAGFEIEEIKELEVAPVVEVPIVDVVKKPVVKEKDPFAELMELAGPKSDCDPLYLKGVIFGMLRMMKKET